MPWAALLALAAALGGGCAALRTAEGGASGSASNLPEGRVFQLSAELDPWANERTPLAVSLVAVYDQDLAARLQKTSARDWFLDRERISAQYPNCRAFMAWSWELVPGLPVRPQNVVLPVEPVRLLLFADYQEPREESAGRATLDGMSGVHAAFGETSWSVRPYTEAPEVAGGIDASSARWPKRCHAARPTRDGAR